ncbi:MAG: rhomboid family intramembrane serine protease [Chloroflexi bacterium]|nr:rhomboid family intramembrane serine protease [Chloroflexota bacterium]MBP8055565.1 rhomboid family intramembrane serine protease [Chloroflexota bacterium]
MGTGTVIDWEIVGKTLGGILIALWGIRFFDAMVFKGKLNNSFSIIPRTSFGVTRILFSPLVHSDVAHLRANTVPLLVLAALLLLNHYDQFWLVTILIIVVDGLGTWLFGSKAKHLGASGLVLGYFGFTLAQLYFNMNPVSLLVAGFVAVFYRGLFLEIFPWRQGTSNVGHLFGFLGGLAAAYFLAGQ